ncbi:unnamed protein product [Allacma fusca]|uniref:F-box domain-containing protein n=1 Tax=Allacma fusca TaxID=39272 RepID=A0A8J2LCX5_9HEXA|nr:unnamed protein product [Allacma fusca]
MSKGKADPDLESFRKEWKLELGLEAGSSSGLDSFETDMPEEEESLEDEEDETGHEENDIESQAHDLFLQGVNCEKTGHFYDAIRFYKKALNLVPDIEHRVCQQQLAGSAEKQAQRKDKSKEVNTLEDEELLTDEEEDLKLRFLLEIEAKGWRWFEKARPDERAHFRDLPEEVIKYILRWIVSTDLDARSLDVLSCVSKGFYVVCRDNQLWQKICERIWGSCHAFQTESEFSTYREMFLTRSRVRFDGCYISKITYIRSGENSFQDQSYRPWHLVEYYRYIFFTPHGQFFFLTTSEHPQSTIPHLRDPVHQTKFNNLLIGHYSLEDHLIYGECWNPNKLRLKNKNGGNVTYNLVMQVLHLKKRFNNGLLWMQYYVNIENPDGSILKNEFDIEQVKFPNFVFSRVKSFTREAQRVLV